jgi:hypothetical protein
MGALEKIQRNLDAIFKLLLLSLIIKNGVVSKHWGQFSLICQCWILKKGIAFATPNI